MVIVGGSGTLVGPILGAAFFMLIEHQLSSYTEAWALAAAGVTLITVIVLAAVARIWPPHDSGPVPIPSVVVLPFVDLSAQRDFEYFCDGLAEELLNALARIEGLKVAARTSSFSYKDKDISVGEIRRALGVATVLEGSVRKSGDRLRITVQLINTVDG